MRARVASVLLSLAAAAPLVAFGGCAGSWPGQGGKLDTLALAAHASEFYCRHGRWPADAAELEAFPLPEISRVEFPRGAEPVPWALLREAELRGADDGSLLVSATLPASRLADGPRTRSVHLKLVVQEPGCWPPAGSSGGP